MFRTRNSTFAPPGALREGVRRTLGGLGRILMTVGLLILLFVAYQLWGTGYFTARDQHDLKAKFQRELTHGVATTTSTTTAATTTSRPGPTTTTVAPPITTAVAPPAEGDPIGLITMPWGDQYAVVEGTSKEDLRKGPGHYTGTPFPGQYGNASIAGHRTTYLHPFYDLDTAHVGEKITVRMVWGTYVYKVVAEPFPVDPHDVSVVDPKWAPNGAKPGGAYLTLTTCNPKYSARQRLILHAELVQSPKAPKPIVYTPPPVGAPKPTTTASLREGLDGGGNSGPAYVWAALVAIAGLLWWWGFRHWRHPLVWLAGLLPFLPVLTMFYVYLERALPNGY